MCRNVLEGSLQGGARTRRLGTSFGVRYLIPSFPVVFPLLFLCALRCAPQGLLNWGF